MANSNLFCDSMHMGTDRESPRQKIMMATIDIKKELVRLRANPQHEDLHKFGIEVGKLYTDQGLPIDMALDRLEGNKEQKLMMLDGVCFWLVQHKRNSGATEKSIARQQQTNIKMMTDFIEKGETGIY